MLPTSPTSQFVMKSTLAELLPTSLIGIIDSYFAFSDATEVLVLGTDGKPADSEANRPAIDSMKLALVSPQCDRGIIREIFKNAIDNGYATFLNDLMNTLRLNKQQIDLDNVDFSGLDLSKLNFGSASMKNANFTGSNLHETSFIGADLTGALGLIGATGQIAVNSLTVLTNTGLYDASEKFNALLGTEPFVIALSGRAQKVNYIGLTMGQTKYLIPFRFAVE